jgi:hypothetical protein
MCKEIDDVAGRRTGTSGADWAGWGEVREAAEVAILTALAA